MSLAEAREALWARQGAGARRDALGAPAGDLDLARRATAYVARMLNALTDAELDGLTARGQPLRPIIAALGLQARRMAEEISRQASDPEPLNLDEAASLSAHALRHLVTHAAVHLNVEWRDLGEEDWPALAHLPRLRAQTLWRVALDLGAPRRDLPAGLLQ